MKKLRKNYSQVQIHIESLPNTVLAVWITPATGSTTDTKTKKTQKTKYQIIRRGRTKHWTFSLQSSLCHSRPTVYKGNVACNQKLGVRSAAHNESCARY